MMCHFPLIIFKILSVFDGSIMMSRCESLIFSYLEFVEVFLMYRLKFSSNFENIQLLIFQIFLLRNSFLSF